MITLATTFSGYAAQLREFIRAATDDQANDTEFNRLALELFALQFAHNRPYRRFCETRKIFPANITGWREIPAMPTAAFKEFELTSLPPDERPRVFHSSGTTGQRPSRHFHNPESLAIYEASLVPWFRQHLSLDGNSPTNFLSLTPPPEQAPNSSLVHMFEAVGHETAPTIFCGQVQSDGAWDLDWQKTFTSLREATASNQPLILLGAAFNFVHLLDRMDNDKFRISLPPSSSVLETGGYKGRSRTMPKEQLHALITKFLGIPAANIICEYGMSELSSQAYDTIAGHPRASGRQFSFPPWARVQIISPETGREVGEAETGLIRIFDLANVYSVLAIQTEDLGIRRGSGFELLGRAMLAEARGCSLQSA